MVAVLVAGPSDLVVLWLQVVPATYGPRLPFWFPFSPHVSLTAAGHDSLAWLLPEIMAAMCLMSVTPATLHATDLLAACSDRVSAPCLQYCMTGDVAVSFGDSWRACWAGLLSLFRVQREPAYAAVGAEDTSEQPSAESSFTQGADAEQGSQQAPAVELRGLRKVWGKHEAVKGLSLKMHLGQMTALLGHNGEPLKGLVPVIMLLLLALLGADEVLCWGFRAAGSVQVAVPASLLKQLQLWPMCIPLPSDFVLKATGLDLRDVSPSLHLVSVSRRRAGSDMLLWALPAGAGKTTAVSMLTGLTQPTEGDALVLGHSIMTDALQVRRKLGYCPQQNVLFWHMSVWEHLQLYAAIKGDEGSCLPWVARWQTVQSASVFWEGDQRRGAMCSACTIHHTCDGSVIKLGFLAAS